MVTEGAREGIAEVHAQLLVEDVGLGGLEGVGGCEHQHVGQSDEGLSPLSAVAGLYGQHHAAVQVRVIHLLHDIG